MRPISVEIAGLLVACLPGIVRIVFGIASASLQRGYRWSAAARNGAFSSRGRRWTHCRRAATQLSCHAFPFFAALVLAVFASAWHSIWSTWGVYLYLAGRLANPAVALCVPGSFARLERGCSRYRVAMCCSRFRSGKCPLTIRSSGPLRIGTV